MSRLARLRPQIVHIDRRNKRDGRGEEKAKMANAVRWSERSGMKRATAGEGGLLAKNNEAAIRQTLTSRTTRA